MAEEENKEEVKEETAAPEQESKEEKKEVPAKFKGLVDQISELSVLDLAELVKVLEDHFGVSAAAPAAVAVAGGAAGGGEAEATEEKANYNIMLTAAGEKKIDVIKAVREVSGLGLAESKAIVDGAPKVVKEGVPTEEAKEAQKKLEEAGATVELQ
ncbi:50S ribosomal protein L7/L12 [Candidatus Saccharibacteria bacterium]|nr:50S ribosomal protein L7/L12 [Candidatus Saccharibacteria bacterium]